MREVIARGRGRCSPLTASGAANRALDPSVERFVPVSVPLDVRRTLAIHRRGPGDPTQRHDPDGSVWRAMRTVAGPATIHLRPDGNGVTVRAWGDGAEVVAAGAEDLLGLADRPDLLVPRHPAVAGAARRLPGLRYGRTGVVLEALVPAILEQKVTGEEARRAWRALVLAHGERAPGPAGLHLAVEPAKLARLPYHAFHPLGVERRRAEVIVRVASDARRLEALTAPDRTPGVNPYAVLVAYPGVGAWTAAEVGARAFGDPDAVSVGDFHLPHLVAWALAGEPRGSDERMLELLEPYRGHRGRVTRLLELAGPRTARRAPRMPIRRFARL